MSILELAAMIGSIRNIRFESVHVPCTIVDVAQAYGRTRIQVSPVNGTGRQWVETDRIGGAA